MLSLFGCARQNRLTSKLERVLWVALWIPLAALLASEPGISESPKWQVLHQWTFDTPDDLQGWKTGVDIAKVELSNNALSFVATGPDPIVELGTVINVEAKPWQCLEISLKADHDGTAEWFWSNTSQGRYGGFSQDMTTRFEVTGDNRWHVYRVFPFWHTEQKILRLRFDPYGGTHFAIRWIRILDGSESNALESSDTELTQAPQRWEPVNKADVVTTNGGISITAHSLNSFALSPISRIQAENKNYVCFRMSVDNGRYGSIFFASRQRRGLHSRGFPIHADGKEHTYIVDMSESGEDWQGEIVALGIRPSESPTATARLTSFVLSNRPQGYPELAISSFAVDEAVPRAGHTTQISARISNVGGTTATNIQATLTVPRGVQVTEFPGTTIRTLGPGEYEDLTWSIKSGRALNGNAVLNVSGQDTSATQSTAPLRFTDSISAQDSYVPPPKPVRGEYEVGVYYFPGWNKIESWRRIESFPERRPVLGWYREGDPEVADWHIKWALEHGITYFAYDWYWSQGARHLEHGLDAYFKSRYHHLLKFCLLWANHNPPHSSSPEDCLAVTRFWITNYFQRPEYLTIQDKPVVIIFSQHRLSEDLGSARVKQCFDSMRAECRKAGINGLYLIACVSSAGQAKLAAQEGYDAVSAYNWPGLGIAGPGKYAPYETLIQGYQRNWIHILEQTTLPFLLPISAGWDSRPWHGESNLIRFGRTPELFKRHLQQARNLLDDQSRSNLHHHVLIEAWNEWGEGSYIEPHQEFGFGYLDAVRQVFTGGAGPHTDLIPADVGRGPYKLMLSEQTFPTEWHFGDSEPRWERTQGLGKVSVQSGVLRSESTDRDPAFYSPPMNARASQFSAVSIKMKLHSHDGKPFTDEAQLFWRNAKRTETEPASVRVPILADGQWHQYRFALRNNPHWHGMIQGLRLDPCQQAQVQIEIDDIALVDATR